jgi:hypothetical protein
MTTDNVAYPMLDQHISEILEMMLFAGDQRASQQLSEEVQKIIEEAVDALIGAYGFEAVEQALHRCDTMKLYVKYRMTV